MNGASLGLTAGRGLKLALRLRLNAAIEASLGLNGGRGSDDWSMQDLFKAYPARVREKWDATGTLSNAPTATCQ